MDCNYLINTFGAQPLTVDICDHYLVKRGIFASHRDFPVNEPFYLYTGRGPSSESLHFGHLIPLLMTRDLQLKYNCPVIIQITDDEKYLTRDITTEKIEEYAQKNIRDIMNLGFSSELTYIFLNSQENCYKYAYKVARHLNFSTMKSVFGMKDSDNIGKIFYPSMQIVPCIPEAFQHVLDLKGRRCLVPCAIDQDPYFRLARDILPKMGYKKPCLLHSNYLPALSSADSKMSSSVSQDETIFLSDSAKVIRKKISRAFSGGRDTREEHERLGGNCDIDVCIQYLRCFMEDEDKYQDIKNRYSSGKLLSGELKKITSDLLIDISNKYK